MLLKSYLLLITFLFTICGSAQTAEVAVRSRAQEKKSGARQDLLPAMLDQQEAALRNGDTGLIRVTTVPLIAELLERMAFVELGEGRLEDAISTLSQSVALQPSDTNRLQLATLLLAVGQNAEAFNQAHVVTTAHSENAEAWTLKGTALRAQGKYDTAVECFERSLRIHEELKVAYALGTTFLAMHEQEKAARVFQKVISASGNAGVWHVAVGDAYREAKEYEKAITEFKLALRTDPHALHANFFLGLTYLQMNEWSPSESSKKYLTLSALTEPHEFAPQFYLGALESSEGIDLIASNKHLEAAATINPTRPEVWQYLGLNASRERDDAKAKQFFRKAIDVCGLDTAQNNYQIRRSYYGLGRLLIKEGKREEGAALLQKYKEFEDLSVAAGGDKISSMSGTDRDGKVADIMPLKGGNLSAAAEPLTVPLVPLSTNLRESESTEKKLRTLLGNTYNDLGTTEARQGNYADALSHFQQAEKWDNNNVQAIRNLGSAAFRANDFLEARRALTLYAKFAVPNDKTSPAVQRAGLMLGFSDFNLGKFAEAAAAFGEVQAATMADPRAAYSWAFSLVRTGQAQEANHIADQLVSQSLPAEQLALVCHLYVDDEDYEGSLACYRKVYAAAPTMPLAHYEAGQALVHLDRSVEAVTELQQEEKLSPGNPNVAYAMAYALLQASQKDEAQVLLVKITTEHPEQAEAQYQLGKLLMEQGRATDAVAHLEASEKVNSSPDYVHYQLGVAYKKAGRQIDADRELKLYREIKDKKRAASSAASSQER